MKSWPVGVIDLLIQAALSPEPQARQAWLAWTAARRFEDITTHEIRLLGSVYPRLPELDPQTPLRPRIDGILKNRWVMAQIKLRATCEAFDCLHRSDIPVLVFKGAAFQAEDLPEARRRVLGDIDILVRPEQVLPAIEVLHRDGWAAANGKSLEYLRVLAPIRLNCGIRKGQHGNVDVHVSPLHYSRDDARLNEQLWERGRPARLNGRPVTVPDPTDSLLIVLAHAIESVKGDWTLEVATRIREQVIDWDRLVETAERRGIVPPCIAGLGYLAHRVGVEVPGQVLARLSAIKAPFAHALKYWSHVRGVDAGNLAERMGERLADAILERQGFSLDVKERRLLNITRSTIAPGALARSARSSLVPASTQALEHRVELPRVKDSARFVARLSFDRPARSRRLFFDVCVDGVAIASLRTRAGGGGSEKPVTRCFRFPFPFPVSGDGSVAFTLSARPSVFLRPSATVEERAEFDAVPFRLDGVWAD